MKPEKGDVYFLGSRPQVILRQFDDTNDVLAVCLFERNPKWVDTVGLLEVPNYIQFDSQSTNGYVIGAIAPKRFQCTFLGRRLGKIPEPFMQDIESFLRDALT